MILPEPPLRTAEHAAWTPKDGARPISEFQRELLALASGLNGEPIPSADFEITEAEAVIICCGCRLRLMNIA
jgi:hypothetical protein